MSEASDVYLTSTIPPSSGLGLNKSAVGAASVFLLRHQPENLEAPPWKPRVSPTVLLICEQQWLSVCMPWTRGAGEHLICRRCFGGWWCHMGQ